MKIQLKRSNVLDSNAAKEPTAGQMEYGELAVNYNEADPAIFIKNSDGDIIRIAGKGALNGIEFPEQGGGAHQPGTIDDRYVEVTGDRMTGNLTVDTRIGIGTDNPQARLHISNDQGGALGRILIDADVSSGYDARIDSTNTGLEFTAQSNTRGFVFNTGSTPTPKVTIKSEGNVGIGTTSPGELLEVEGDSDPQIKVLATNTGTNSAGLYIGNEGQRNWQIWADRPTDTFRVGRGLRSTTDVVINSDGNVGIGTEGPGGQLTVRGNGTNYDTTLQLEGELGAISAPAKIRMAGTSTSGSTSQISEIISYQPTGGGGSDAALGINVRKNGDGFGDPNRVVTILGSGEVGIGTDNPKAKLHVDGTILSEVINYGDNQDKAYLIAGTTGYTGADSSWGTYGFQHRFKSDSGGTSRVTIDTNTGEAFCVTSAQNVGIGTDNPQAKLHVIGEVRGGRSVTQYITLSGDSSGNKIQAISEPGNPKPLVIETDSESSNLQIRTSGPTDNGIYLQPGGSTAMTLLASGNVGISTNDPKAKLHVKGSQVRIQSDTGGELQIIPSTSTTPNIYRFGGTTGDNSKELRFRTAGDLDRLTIDKDGNVGISTISPKARLDVNGYARINAPADYWATTGTYYDVSGYGGLATQGSYSIYLTCNGYRGADNKWVSKETNNYTGASQIMLMPTGDISFRTEADKATGSSSNVALQMIVTKDGNVGIGTDSPQAKLDINGKARSTSTAAADVGTTLATKDYVDASSGGGGGSTTINYSGAAAWGNIDGDNTILGGMNVASVTGTTRREVKFLTPMPNGNYSVVATSTNNDVYTGNRIISQDATGFEYSVTNAGGAAGPSFPFNFAVHALNALPPKGGTGTDAWATVDKTTVNGPCNVPASFNVASVTRTDNGRFDVVFTTPMPTANYAINISPGIIDSELASRAAGYRDVTVNGFSITLRQTDTSSVTRDAEFSFTVNATNATLPETVTQEQIDSAINNPGASAWGYIDENGDLVNGLNCTCVKTGTSGERQITFVTPLPTANYSITTGSAGSFSSANAFDNVSTYNLATTGFTIRSKKGSTFNDTVPISFAVFAINALPPKGGTGTDAWGTVEQTSSNGPCVVPGSFNISSVSRISKGKFAVVFTTPMPTANYAAQVTCRDQSSRDSCVQDLTVTGFTVHTYSASGNTDDYAFSFTVNATNATLPSTFTEAEIQSVLDFIKTGGNSPVAILQDIQPINTNSPNGGAGWKTRVFNTEDDVFNLVSLAASGEEFTLQPGAYLIEWFAGGTQMGRMQTKLTNVTTNTTAGLGSNTYSNSTADYSQGLSTGTARIQIATASTFKIEQNSQGSSGWGFGMGSLIGPALNAQVKIQGTPSL